jgi:hypothetical protein
METIKWIVIWAVVVAAVVALFTWITWAAPEDSVEVHKTQTCVSHKDGGTWKLSYDKCIDTSNFK